MTLSITVPCRPIKTEEPDANPAGRTGESRVPVFATELRDRLERIHRRNANRSLVDELDEIALHCASRPVLDDRADEDMPGYDELGLPT